MRTLLAVIGIIIVILVIVLVTQKFTTPGKSTNQAAMKTTDLKVGKYTFTLEIAKTESDQKMGLSGRNSLAADHGMVFPFSQPGFYAFWMKNVQFPLDIIYLKGKQVVTIFENVKNPSFPTDSPQIYKPDSPADTVVELQAGTAQKLGLKKGQTLNLSL